MYIELSKIGGFIVAEELNFKAELVGVFGDPISENPTGVMFEAAFEELGLKWRYLPIQVFEQDLGDAIKGLKAFNMKGINLTIPHKVHVMKYLDEIASDAELIGAINTVRDEKGKLIGENTDGKGFLKSVKEDAKIDPKDKNVVVLGAGGAAKAIAVELALAGVKHITIVNRSPVRGKELVDRLNDKTNTTAVFVKWNKDYVIPEETDLLVNATSIGLYPDVTEKPTIVYDSIKEHMTVCDVIPNPPNTLFLAEAKKQGANTVDGMGMLVNQGVIAFKMWTGQDAPVQVMQNALCEVFGE